MLDAVQSRPFTGDAMHSQRRLRICNAGYLAKSKKIMFDARLVDVDNLWY